MFENNYLKVLCPVSHWVCYWKSLKKLLTFWRPIHRKRLIFYLLSIFYTNKENQTTIIVVVKILSNK